MAGALEYIQRHHISKRFPFLQSCHMGGWNRELFLSHRIQGCVFIYVTKRSKLWLWYDFIYVSLTIILIL